MSLGIIIKCPEGLVLAAESRVTLTSTDEKGVIQYQATFDNATKLLSFSPPRNYMGVITYGQAGIGLRTAYSYLTEFEEQLPQGSRRMKVSEFGKNLTNFFMNEWGANMPSDYADSPMTFVIGGYDKQEPYGSIYKVEIPYETEPVAQSIGSNFGISWGGQTDIVARLLQGYDNRLLARIAETLKLDEEQMKTLTEVMNSEQMPIPYGALSLQDSVDLAIFFIRTTINAQKLTVMPRGCGGAIDVCTITRSEGLKYVQRKEVTGEGNQL